MYDKINIKQRPRFEGCNIETWLGFKHLMYLSEEALLEFFRIHKISQRDLYLKYDVNLEIRFSKIDIIKAVNTDDELDTVVYLDPKSSFPLFIIKSYVGDTLYFKSKIQVLFNVAGNINEIKDINLKQLITKGVESNSRIQVDKEIKLRKEEPLEVLKEYFSSDAFVYKKRIPYYYCHYNNYVLHSGYVRFIEEAVDLFLESRGLSIKRMLQEKKYIPFVSNTNINIIDHAEMEEDIYIVFKVNDVYKDAVYLSNIYFYVKRNEKLQLMAFADITHGYSVIHDKANWNMVTLDQSIVSALKNEN